MPDTITAEIPYVVSDDDLLVFSSADRTFEANLVRRRPMQIRNGRLHPPSLEREGLQIASCPSRLIHERLDEFIDANIGHNVIQPAINFEYWKEIIPTLQRLTGAREIFAHQGTTVRFSPRSGRKNWGPPAGYAHVDFQPDEVERLMKESMEQWGIKARPYSRLMLIQTWRPLSDPPQDIPFAVCDGRTVKSEDLIPVEFHVVSKEQDLDLVYRSRAGRYGEGHQWWYFPNMTVDEIMVFKGFDSALPETMNPLHAAFEDATAQNPVPRVSAESRFFALFD
jgi:hypothetical protein